ncbi:hypothetical protein PV325_006252 [Microctonus aethiopoides]|nr:hypothetical protein PV325_006252 [Microctonus aethiopoides]
MKLYRILFITITVVLFAISYSEAFPNNDMHRQSCFSNTDCPENYICFESGCSNPCRNNGGRYPVKLGPSCGKNAECKTTYLQGTHCSCKKGFMGNPLDECY